MTLKLYALLGLILVITVIVVVVTESDRPSPADNESESGEFPASNSDPEAPSKENASTSVKETIGHLREVVEQNPNDAAALLELATLLQNAHAPGEAAVFYERGLRIDSLNVDSRIDYSLCLFEIGRPLESLEQSRTVIRLDPGNAKGLYNIGAIYANGGRRDSADFYWSRLLELHNDGEMADQTRASLKKLRETRSM